MGIWDILSGDSKQRAAALADLDTAIGESLSYYLGPTGLPQRIGAVSQMTPSAGLGRAGQASMRMATPGMTPGQRIGAAGEMLSETAAFAAPLAMGARGFQPMFEAVQDATMGFNVGARAIGEGMAARANQPGPMPTVYSNPVMRAADELPTPRNEAEAVAKQILEMRAAGRAGDVTDEMMAAADPQYMFNNTPLPMDYESRMARAGDMGFGGDMYHGDEVRSDAKAFYRPNQPAYFAYDPDDAGDYASYATNQDPEAGRMFGSGAQTQVVKVRAQNTAQADDVSSAYEAVSGMDRDYLDRQSWVPLHPDWSDYSGDVADELQRRQFDSVFFDDDSTPLNGEYINSLAVLNPPTNIRSRFARFDPEFRHLRNLSAGFGGLGLLAYPQEED